MKSNIDINNLIKHSEFSTKIKLFFADRKEFPDGYDSAEGDITATINPLNPITVKGYMVSSENKVIWRNIGKDIVDAQDFYCQKKYKKWFERCIKITIDGEEYEVWKDGTGKTGITIRPFNLIRITLGRKV